MGDGLEVGEAGAKSAAQGGEWPEQPLARRKRDDEAAKKENLRAGFHGFGSSWPGGLPPASRKRTKSLSRQNIFAPT